MHSPAPRSSAGLLAFAVIAASACHRSPPPAEDPWAETTATDAARASDASAAGIAHGDPGELLPGTVRAFGLLMPMGTTQVVGSENQRMFYVDAPMSAVMRYLQQRVDIITGEIHPLGAMIHNAHVHTAGPGENFTLDLGVRDEGGRTLVTLWNRSQLPVPPRSEDDGFRAAGFDPRTRRPIGSNNF